MTDAATVPEGVDPETGGVLPAAAPPSEKETRANTRRHAKALRPEVSLDTPAQIEKEIKRELRVLEAVGHRLGNCRKELKGWRDGGGNFISGADWEVGELKDTFIATLYRASKEGSGNPDAPKFPGEDARQSLANVAINEMPGGKELRQQRAALTTELTSLEEFRRLTEARINALQSLLSFKREEARLDSFHPHTNTDVRG